MELCSDLITSDFTRVEHEDDWKYNAPHHFTVVAADDGRTLTKVDFQEGPIKETGINGVHNEDLIAMVIRRLEGFQGSDWACRENAMAIQKLEESLMWLRKRTNARFGRGVEGTSAIS